MNTVDYVVLILVALILASAVYAIYRSKKSGKKCIGCPDSGNCPSAKTGPCHCNDK